MKKNIGLCLFLKSKTVNIDGKGPIYLRITLHGKGNVAVLSTGKTILPKVWQETKQLKIAKKEELVKLRSELMEMRMAIFNLYKCTQESGIILTTEELKRRYLNPNEGEMNSKTLLNLLEFHTEIFDKLVKVNLKSKSSRTKYNTVTKHLKSFLLNELKIEDIKLEALNFSFIQKFDFYLRLKYKICNNSTVKYCQFLRAIISTGIKYDYLRIDPFKSYEGKLVEVKTNYLNEEQIQIIEEKQFSTQRLNIVKDVFLLSCYTGYAPVDIAKLRHADIKFNDDQFCIYTTRQKTKIESNVPLLPQAIKIIEKYKNHERCQDGRLVPYNTNQTMNESLKEIGDLCGIPFSLHYYVSRHSFAVLCINNDVPIEILSKMLGHKRIAQTQHYAKLLNKTVSLEMKKLSQKLKEKQKVLKAV